MEKQPEIRKLTKEELESQLYNFMKNRPGVSKEGDWYRIDTGDGNVLYTQEGGMKMFNEAMRKEGERIIKEYQEQIKKDLENPE